MNYVFDYSGLWELLKRKNLTKSDLRQRLSFSTSTLAKLSAGQSVSMELLADIATALNCDLRDIVQLRPEYSPGPWKGLLKGRSFCIRLLLNADDDKADYLYGYATPYSMTDEGVSQWKIESIPGQPGALVLEGYADGELLRDLIASAEERESLGQFLDKGRITIRSSEDKKKLEEMVRSVVICGGKSTYRAPFLLLPWQACRKLRQRQLPELSPTNEVMICESLIGLGKQELYCTDGMPDTKKMQRLLEILRSEFPACRSTADAKRLGNFEVLSYPSGTYDGKFGIGIRVENGDNADSAVQTIRLIFDKSELYGSFLIEIITYADVDPVSDTIREVYCSGEPLEITLYSQQLVSQMEVKIWENGTTGHYGGELIAHWVNNLTMECVMGIDVVEQQFSFVDRWSKMLSRRGKELVASRVSRMSSFPLESTASNPWKADDDALECAFKDLLPDPREPDMDQFFPAGEENQVKYVEWLEGVLQQRDVQRVILIDPYVKLDTISVLFQCLKDTGPAWEVYMDRSKKDALNHIEEIQKAKAKLDLAAPPDFSIWSVDGKLHDRFLILLGKDTVTAYVLSNSFDTVAEKYSSAVVRVGNRLARTISESYLQLFSDEQKASKLIEVYSSHYNQKKRSSETKRQVKDIRAGLPAEIDPLGQAETVDEAADVIARFLKEGTVEMEPYFQSKCLGVMSYLAQGKSVDHKLLMGADCLSTQEIINDHHFTWRIPVLYRAVMTLLRLDLHAFLDVLKQITVIPLKNEVELRPGFLSIVMMFALLEGNGNLFQDAGARKIFFASELASIRAIAAVQCIHAAQIYYRRQEVSIQDAVETLREHLTPEEFLCAAVFFVRELRIFPRAYALEGNEERLPVDPEILYPYIIQAVQNCRGERRGSDAIQEVLTPLYPEFSHDIGCVLYEAWKAGAVKKNAALNLFSTFILKRYQGFNPPEKDFFRPVDLERSCEMLDLACKIDLGVVQQVQRGMKKLERNLASRLYQPFLRRRNYDVWKHSIDLFGCLVFLELYIAQKGIGCCNEIAVNEYKKICENFETDLRQYSEIYRAVERQASIQP